MEKNYYDILQINKNASPEIIEKAYKVLAKKYHPDLQQEENKKQAEEILKEINEAYEVLSDSEKKASYDASLLEIPPRGSYDDTLLKEQLQQERQYQEQLQREQDLAYQEQLQQARAKAYHDAYIQDLKNRGYKIRYKKSLKDYLRGFVSVLVVVLVLFLLCQLPFVKVFLAKLYEENDLVHWMVDLFSSFFN